MSNNNKRIEINVSQQHLYIYEGDEVVFDTAIASATNGTGEINGSECTPRGRHFIRAKIGAGSVPNTVFVARRPTGEIYSPELRAQYPDRDWILTRILWLCGAEPGRNRFGNVDTMRRYIYIHGAPVDDAMGIPSSHGCIKMRNSDVIELFDRIDVGTPVLIYEH